MRKISYIVFILVLVEGCSKKSDNRAVTPVPPGKAVLSLPAQNSSCTAEQVVSAGVSRISFSWADAQNANSYELVIHNLQTTWDTTVQSMQAQTSVALARGAAYSWYVVSLSNMTADTVHSAAWKFYNPGAGTTTYVPFPAELNSPGYGQQFNSAGTVTLSWTGSSVGNETLTYDVYLGTSAQQLVLYQSKISTMSLNVNVQANTTYYWQVISRDSLQNSATSTISEFSVQ